MRRYALAALLAVFIATPAWGACVDDGSGECDDFRKVAVIEFDCVEVVGGPWGTVERCTDGFAVCYFARGEMSCVVIP